MSSTVSFTWTSRTEMCAELSRLVFDAETTTRSRARASRLLSLLAKERDAPILRQLALDLTRSARERADGLEGLSRIGVPLSGAEIDRLLGDRPLEVEGLRHFFGVDSEEVLARAVAAWRAKVIELAKTSETKALVIERLDRLSPIERYEIARFLDSEKCVEVSAWLFQNWLEKDRQVEGAHEVQWRWLGDHAEARRLVFDRWCHATSEARQEKQLGSQLSRALGNDRALCGELLDRPAELAQALEELLAPLPLLLDQLGVHELERRIAKIVLTPEGRCGIPGSVRDWPPTWELLAERLSDAEIPLRVRRNLLHALWSRSYDRTIAWCMAHMDEEAHRSLVLEVLWERLERDRGFREHHRPFLLRALADREIDFRAPAFLGLWGLERDGHHDVSWRAQVETFLESADARHALHAHAALFELGDVWRAEILVRATDSEDRLIRASAFELLGKVAPSAHVAVLGRELLESRGDPKRERASSAFYAMRGLARAATKESLTILLRAWFLSVSDFDWRGLEDRIAEAAVRLEANENVPSSG